MTTGPLHESPKNFRPPFDVYVPDDYGPDAERWRARRRAEREQALRNALAGIDLGAFDERMIVHWAAGDDPELGTLISLILRARAAGPR